MYRGKLGSLQFSYTDFLQFKAQDSGMFGNMWCCVPNLAKLRRLLNVPLSGKHFTHRIDLGKLVFPKFSENLNQIYKFTGNSNKKPQPTSIDWGGHLRKFD